MSSMPQQSCLLDPMYPCFVVNYKDRRTVQAATNVSNYALKDQFSVKILRLNN